MRRSANAEQYDRGAGGLAGLDDRLQVYLHSVWRDAAQAVVAAELENNQRRGERVESLRDSRRAALGRLAGDTGVNHAMFVPLALQPCLQQSDPGLVNFHTVTCTKAIAVNEHGRGISTVCNRGN